MDMIGQLHVKRRQEKSFCGYDPSALKSGIQKYARRQEIDKGLWCLIEMDLFGLLETDGTELKAYLQKYPKEDKENVQRRARSIRTNMINRLVVMMSEEISICAWWLPLEIYKLREKWLENRNNAHSQKFLLDMYYLLTSQKMIRIISDLKSVYLLPPDYVKPEQMEDLRYIHRQIQKKYPQVFARQNMIGKLPWTIDFNKYPQPLKRSLQGISYCLEKEKDQVFYWLNEFIILNKEQQNLKYVWGILYLFLEKYPKYVFMYEVVQTLEKFYKQMSHKEKPIYLYHAILLWIRKKAIDWKSKSPQIDISLFQVEKLYKEHQTFKLEIDEYILDLHTHQGKRPKDMLQKFALEGAYVKNQENRFLNVDYRQIYILLKQKLDLYRQRGCIVETEELTKLAQKTQVPIKKLSQQIEKKLAQAPQAQKRTSSFKKAVYILDDLVYKGPYQADNKSLMNNLKYTYALELLEDVLSLEEKLRTSLKWKCIGCAKNDYYLVTMNVGDPKKIVANCVSSKIEENVTVVQRETIIQRVSEMQKTSSFTKEIGIATLQHLYLRFLLDIGDSGPHNILVRQDHQKSKRLVVGNDLEEKRTRHNHNQRLECLFRKKPSKLEVRLYSDLITKIHSLSFADIEEKVKNTLVDIGIDIKKLKQNIELWERLAQT